MKKFIFTLNFIPQLTFGMNNENEKIIKNLNINNLNIDDLNSKETYKLANECIDNYIFLKEPLVNKNNCLMKCNNYYYFDENNKYFCTPTHKCNTNYKLIKEKKKCINKCIDDYDKKYL